MHSLGRMSISTAPAPGLDEAVCSLADVTAARGPLAEGEARAVAVAAAAALALIHDAGRVRGRIGPADLVLTGRGDLKLAESAATAGAVPAARDLGRLFGRGAESGLTLPEPVVPAVRADPTPTMDYPFVRAPAQPVPAPLR